MRKASFLLHACAIVLSITAAIAFTTSPTEKRLLYYKSGDNYYPAGHEDDYICRYDESSVCTYTYNVSTGQYEPYQTGKYILKDK